VKRDIKNMSAELWIQSATKLYS